MHNIGYLLSDGFQVLAVGTQSVFEFANLVTEEPFYNLTNFSVGGGEVLSSIGMSLKTHPLPTHRASIDTWIVAGVLDPISTSPAQGSVSFLQTQKSTRRIGAICTGAFILAEAGLLNGKRATTHWVYAGDMQALYPDIQVEGDLI